MSFWLAGIKILILLNDHFPQKRDIGSGVVYCYFSSKNDHFDTDESKFLIQSFKNCKKKSFFVQLGLLVTYGEGIFGRRKNLGRAPLTLLFGKQLLGLS